MDAANASPPYRGIVVSHTHWDRAWYLPFERFRVRLVRLVDRVMDLLEDDSSYRAFTLDGQTVLLEDYLEVRPDQEDRLRRLIEQERMLIGPWYTLPDLFLVSGEALIRNLQEGQRLCARFGSTMPVGYIPDPFGHIAQMPQLLRGFGLDTYLFMRGLDAETKERLGSVFNWEAPNGDRVLAIYQPDGYFPAAALGHPGPYGRFDGRAPLVDEARTQIEEAVAKMGALQEERTVLLSNGFDHMPEQPELPALLDALNEQMDTVTLEHGTLPMFVDALKSEACAHGTYRGDLLGNVDHPILSSVYSTRIYLKQQNHRAQRLLSRYAEPMSAWLDAESTGPDARPVLRHAWKTLLRNHPHDDICGCSVDAVHEDNEARFRHVMETGTELLVEHLEHLQKHRGFEAPAGTGARSADVWVFNPHPWQATYRVKATLLFPSDDGTRASAPPPEPLNACDGTGNDVPIRVLTTTGGVMRNPYLEQTWGRRYTVCATVTVPPLGYQMLHVYASGNDSSQNDASSNDRLQSPNSDAPAVSTGPTLERANDQYRLFEREGALYLEAKAAGQTMGPVLQFEYQLDAGDTYSFGPVPEHGPWWARCTDIAPHPHDPHALQMQHVLQVPASYDRAQGPQGRTTLHLTTNVQLGVRRALEITTRYTNTARDGRLRAVLPAHAATRTAWADGHFRWAPRSQQPMQTPESHPDRYGGYPGELRYPTHHQGDGVMVEAEGLRTWVANRGLPEFELVDAGGTPGQTAHIAVTLHRAVGMLSVEGGRLRDCQAGPSMPTPGAQCQRDLKADLAYGVGPWERATVLREMRMFAHPAWTREMPALPHVTSEGARPRTQSLLTIDTPEVEVTAVTPAPAPRTQAVRLCNRSGTAQRVALTIGWPVEAYCYSDLNEQWDDEAATPLTGDTLTTMIKPHAIQTLLLRGTEA